MIQSAVADIVGTVVESWYVTVATPSWIDDGADHCAVCSRSPFTRAASLDSWPHAVVHPLVEVMDRVARSVAASLEEEDADGIAHDWWVGAYSFHAHDHLSAATRMVVSEFGGHAADVHDVLTQCVRGDLAAAS